MPRRISEPVLASMRADLGFIGASEVEGTHRVEVPAGYYVETAGWVEPAGHVRAWDVINSIWVPKSGQRPINIPAFEIYEKWPLPWLESRMQISLGLDMDMGEPVAW